MDIPGMIYLQIEHDGERSDPCDWTHCADRVNDSDIEYTRARVQTAAPDLLAACGSALWVLNNRHNKDAAQWERYAQAAEKDLRAAIAAARGK